MNVKREFNRINRPQPSKRICLSVLFLCAGLLPFRCSLAEGRLSNDLQHVPAGTVLDIIIQFRLSPSAADIAEISQSGGSIKRSLPNIRGGLFTVPAAALEGIAHNPNVAYISPDRKVSGTLEFANPTVRADVAFNYAWNGAGVTVAVVDSGIYADHPDLKGRVVYSENFAPNESVTVDEYGHGTHVAGIVAGDGTASTGRSYLYTFRGIAPKASLVSLRALDGNGQGTDSSVISAIDRAIALKNVYGIRVLNLSLGRQIQESYGQDPLCRELQAAWQSGLVVVVAAGNNGRDNSMGTSGYGTITSPGNSPYGITVGAMKDLSTAFRGDDLIASYSSKGPTLLDHVVKPDILAPGNSIAAALAPSSALAQQYPGNIVPVSYYKAGGANTAGPYIRLSGTSMAAPMVSGAAALLLQKDPSLTPDGVKAKLMKTATKNFPAISVWTDPATGAGYASTYDLFTVGAGYLDVWAALNNNDAMTGTALSPLAFYNSTAANVSLLYDSTAVWNTTAVWGAPAVWGSNVIVNGNSLNWSSGAVWGSSSVGGFTVVWGSTVVWGTSQPLSESVSIRGDI